MFAGIAEQLRPWAHHCSQEFQRLMSRLESIQATIADTSPDPFERRSYSRFTVPGNAAPTDPFFTVPIGQVWVVEAVTLNGPTIGVGARVVLSQAPNMSLPLIALQTDSAGSVGVRGATITPNVVIPPNTPVYYTVTDNTGALDVYVQVRQVDIPTMAEPAGLITRRAHSGGSNSPEGRTSSDGPPQHELGRDARALPTPSR